MEARDGRAGFDFRGAYSKITPYQLIDYVIEDGRKVIIHFIEEGSGTRVEESFDMEDENSDEMQRAGWQAIMDNFKKYVESQA